jgi:hypothetical protein
MKLHCQEGSMVTKVSKHASRNPVHGPKFVRNRELKQHPFPATPSLRTVRTTGA